MLVMIACLGIVLLPFAPGRAQAPAKKPPIATEPQDEKVADELAKRLYLQRFVDQGTVLQQHQVQQRDELEAKRAQLEAQLKELLRAIESLKAQPKPETSKVPTAPGPGSTLGTPGAKVAPGGGYPGGGGSAYKPAPAPTGGTLKATGSVEQRLDQVEKKLDTLLWEITNLRRDMAKGHGAALPPPASAPPGFSPPGKRTGGTSVTPLGGTAPNIETGSTSSSSSTGAGTSSSTSSALPRAVVPPPASNQPAGSAPLPQGPGGVRP
jgi:hypothetical protein